MNTGFARSTDETTITIGNPEMYLKLVRPLHGLYW
jgi:hypothetical protein